MAANPALRVSEADLQQTLMDTARLFGWRRVHIRAVPRPDGKWGVPYEGDLGLPDLILARDGRVLLVELKSDTGSPTAEQAAWLAAAGPCGRLWRPSDLPAAINELRGG